MESYTDAASGRMVNNYYWQTRESMELLINNLQHQQAKSQSHKWLSGYQTIIAEIQGCHNVNLPHPLASFSVPMRDAIVYVLNVGHYRRMPAPLHCRLFGSLCRDGADISD